MKTLAGIQTQNLLTDVNNNLKVLELMTFVGADSEIEKADPLP